MPHFRPLVTALALIAFCASAEDKKSEQIEADKKALAPSPPTSEAGRARAITAATARRTPGAKRPSGRSSSKTAARRCT